MPTTFALELDTASLSARCFDSNAPDLTYHDVSRVTVTPNRVSLVTADGQEHFPAQGRGLVQDVREVSLSSKNRHSPARNLKRPHLYVRLDSEDMPCPTFTVALSDGGDDIVFFDDVAELSFAKGKGVVALTADGRDLLASQESR